jgi:chromosome partitioning protein
MTPMVVTVAQQKGGAGKTTIAAHLAAFWADKGYPVGLIDVDRQASLTQWYQRRQSALRQDAGTMRLSSVSGWYIRSEVQRLGRDHKIVIIDTPPHADTESRFALRVASLVIAPVQPSPLDLWATKSVLDMARAERVPTLIVLNRVPARARLTVGMVEEIAKFPVPIASARLGNRVAFAATLVEGVSVADSRLSREPWCFEAAHEVAELASELVEFITHGSSRRRAAASAG